MAEAQERCVPVTVRPRWSERDLDAAWETCALAVRRCLAALPGAASRVIAVGIAGHGDGLHLLDARRRPVRPGITALDGRAYPVLREWASDGRLDAIRERTGVAPHAASPATLATWVRSEEPAAWRATRWLVCAKDWLRLELTGELATDPTDASALLTSLHDRNAPDAAALALLGLDELAERVPPVRASCEVVGALTDVAAVATGLPARTPVVCGAHDTHVAALGTGVVEPGRLSVVAGTWSINQTLADVPRTDARWEAHAALEPGAWLHMATSPTSAVSLDWILDRLGFEGAVADAVREAADAPADPAPIVFHPFLHGTGDAEVPSLVLGLRGWHTRGHLLRAVLDGIVLRHREHVEALREAFAPAGAARLAGGAARSPFWCQLFADGLGTAIEVTDLAEAGTRGAAALAGVGAGLWPDTTAAGAATVRLERTYEPDPDGTARLDDLAELSALARERLAPLDERFADG